MALNIKFVFLSLSFIFSFNRLISLNFLEDPEIDIKNFQEKLKIVSEDPTKKLLYKNKKPVGFLDLETTEIITSETFLELMADSFSKNKLLIVAKVVIAKVLPGDLKQKNNLKQENIITFYEAYNLIYYLFKDRFLDIISGTFAISPDNFTDPVHAKIIAPIELYYIDRFDHQNFEYIGEFSFNGQKPKSLTSLEYKNLKEILKTFFIANIPVRADLPFSINNQDILNKQIDLADLFITGCAFPRIFVDHPNASKILLHVISQTRNNKDINLNKLSYRALLYLFKIFVNKNNLEYYKFVFNNFLENLESKKNKDLELAVKEYYKNFLLYYKPKQA